jgi:hypothetical protein
MQPITGTVPERDESSVILDTLVNIRFNIIILSTLRSHICGLFYDSGLYNVEWYDELVNYELGGIWKHVVVGLNQGLSRNSTRGPEERHEERRRLVLWPKFELSTLLI